jgi:hypothetical protein
VYTNLSFVPSSSLFLSPSILRLDHNDKRQFFEVLWPGMREVVLGWRLLHFFFI